MNVQTRSYAWFLTNRTQHAITRDRKHACNALQRPQHTTPPKHTDFHSAVAANYVYISLVYVPTHSFSQIMRTFTYQKRRFQTISDTARSRYRQLIETALQTPHISHYT